MSLSLPTNDLRELFDIQALVDYRNLPTFQQALAGCRKTVLQPSVDSAAAVTMRADGEIWLIRVGKKGGWKRLWNFGNPTA